MNFFKKKWYFQNVNFVKNEILKMWILWKLWTVKMRYFGWDLPIALSPWIIQLCLWRISEDASVRGGDGNGTNFVDVRPGITINAGILARNTDMHVTSISGIFLLAKQFNFIFYRWLVARPRMEIFLHLQNVNFCQKGDIKW